MSRKNLEEMTIPVDSVHHLNYKGDHRGEYQIVGPDLFGGMWQPVWHEYDEETDMTTMTLIPYFKKEAI